MSSLWNMATSILNQALPIGATWSALQNLDPRMKVFLSSGLAAGFGANQIFDYLRSQAGSKPSISKGEKLRSDEEAALNRREKEEVPSRLLQTGLSLAAGAGVGQLMKGIAPSAKGIAMAGAGKQVTKPTVTGSQQLPTGAVTSQKSPTLREKILQDVKAQQGINFDPLMGLRKKYPRLASFAQKEAEIGTPPQDIARKAKPIKALQSEIKSVEEDTGQSFADVLTQMLGVPKQAPVQANTGLSDEELIKKTLGMFKG